MSLSVERFGLNWDLDGETTQINVRVATSAGNPVPEGTRVQFSTEGGQIQTSCTLTGATVDGSALSGCSVSFGSQDRRPSDGLVTILAWLEGEEAYVDVNGNGRYDEGEPFVDAGRIYRDDNGNGVYDEGFDELNVGQTVAGAPGIGTLACATSNHPNLLAVASVPDTCDGVWGRTLIRDSVQLPTSSILGAGALQFGDTIAVFSRPGWMSPDAPSIAAPTGTALTARTPLPQGCTVSFFPATVPNGAVGPTFHQVIRSDACAGSPVDLLLTLDGFSVLVPLQF